MRAVLLDVPEHLLAERRRLGHDHRDEMWEGELHMVPQASEEHQWLGGRLLAHLMPRARARGLRMTMEVGVFDPAVAEPSSYRVPDLAAYDPGVTSPRGIEGTAALVIEIRSPGDETLDKIAWYSRVGSKSCSSSTATPRMPGAGDAPAPSAWSRRGRLRAAGTAVMLWASTCTAPAACCRPGRVAPSPCCDGATPWRGVRTCWWAGRWC